MGAWRTLNLAAARRARAHTEPWGPLMTSSMENPSYAGAAPEEQEARGAAEELEVEPERGASPEAASAEGGALVRGLSFALRLLGSNSRGQFLFIQALLVLNVFCRGQSSRRGPGAGC